MYQLREFAQKSAEFDKLKVKIVAISVDDTEHGRAVWEKAALQKFPILSDKDAKVIRKYGLLMAGGDDGKSPDIAIRTTLLVDEKGREVWRRVSETANDFPRGAWVLDKIRAENRRGGSGE